MKPEHSEIIEAMAEAIQDCLQTSSEYANSRTEFEQSAKAALRAAAERGWVLARPKGGFECEIKIAEMDEYLRGWYDALKSIEVIEIDKEQSE